MPESTMWMLVREGIVQYLETDIDGKREKVWPVARTHEDAVKLAAHFGKKGIVPAQIGSVQEETLKGHITLAIQQGCVGALVVQGWNDDGSPQYGFQDYRD